MKFDNNKKVSDCFIAMLNTLLSRKRNFLQPKHLKGKMIIYRNKKLLRRLMRIEKQKNKLNNKKGKLNWKLMRRNKKS